MSEHSSKETIAIPLSLRLMDVCGHQVANPTCLLCEAATCIGELERENAELRAAISTPENVWVNMLRGKIARPQALDHYEELKTNYEQLEREKAELRSGLRLIAEDEHRLMNETARQTATSILSGKPSGRVSHEPLAVRCLPFIKQMVERMHASPVSFGLEGRPWQGWNLLEPLLCDLERQSSETGDNCG